MAPKPKSQDQEEESPQGHRLRRGPHPVHVQQHDHHHHRPPGRDRLLDERRHGRVQGRPQGHALRRPAGRQGSGQPKAREFGVRYVDVRIKGPGAGRESAIRALQSGRARDQVHQGRDPHPAQRLPGPPAAAGLAKESTMARYQGPICRLCRVEKNQALPQGQQVPDRQVPARAAGLRARPARPQPEARPGLRDPAPGEAEAEALLRDVGGAVPPLLQAGRAAEGHHRREPPVDARAAAGQRPLRHGLRPFPRPRPPARRPRPLPR